MSLNRIRRKVAPPNTTIRYTKEGYPYEVDKVTGERIFDEGLDALYMTAKGDVNSYKYSNVLIDEFDKFMPKNDGKGTSDNPLNLSSDDEDDYTSQSSPMTISNNNKNESTLSSSSTTTTTTTTTDNNNNNNGQQDLNGIVQDVTPVCTDILDDQGNIKLKAGGFTIYTNRIKILQHPVLFKTEAMEIPIDLKTIQPNTSIKNEITLIINYSDLLKFTFSFLKDNGTLMINTKEFSFTKYWLKDPKTVTNKEYGIPGDILIKGIDKRHYLLLKDLLIEKSCWIKLLIKTEEAGKVVNNVIVTYPPIKDNPNIMDIVRITEDDLLRLESSNYLNDNLIDFYIRYIKNHYVHPRDENRFHFFSTFFYNNLSLKNIEEAYKKISKWTRDTDIFSKDFLFIPINENFHWTLCIVSFCGQDPKTSTNENRPLIMHLDSLGGNKNAFHNKIRSYLQMEWKYKKSIPSNGTIPEREFNATTLPAARVYIPKQDNLYDCGVFLLHYIELFCRNPETNFEQPLKRPKWFPLSDIPDKRNTIKTLLLFLKAEQELEDEDDEKEKKEKEGEEEKEKINGEEKKGENVDTDVDITTTTTDNDDKEKEKEKENNNTTINTQQQNNNNNNNTSTGIDPISQKELDCLDKVVVLINEKETKRKRQPSGIDVDKIEQSNNNNNNTNNINDQQKKKKKGGEGGPEIHNVDISIENLDDSRDIEDQKEKSTIMDVDGNNNNNNNIEDRENGNGNGKGKDNHKEKDNKMENGDLVEDKEVDLITAPEITPPTTNTTTPPATDKDKDNNDNDECTYENKNDKSNSNDQNTNVSSTTISPTIIKMNKPNQPTN
ncbi:hypothetical protein DFA_11229 [Cavenderia fasciculata]|uniref:Ubiquitin-like protease family profile domain-containing protein n=1 Tax=Cavenderia fasciculata TaxID=261658 RepID=F4QFL5_CACFS|nr:uncharacterized protein DFA_11229 [Cavenderia fasciculata]EGG13468.1 hypothetical protein DFA_11229 [Cavenderia fasciculata]|eukprot:XP_004350172.1 hypothetical protein DFA_11229 [Cavenderia fasciculata]